MKIEERIKAIGINLPENSKPGGMYVPVKHLGNALYVAGQVPFIDGKLKYTGKVGKERTLEEAQDAAKICIINLLAAVKDYIGDLDKIVNVIKLQAFVSSEVGFTEQHIVVNAASELLYEIFGEPGRHARTAVGTNQLPLDATVEIEAILEYK